MRAIDADWLLARVGINEADFIGLIDLAPTIESPRWIPCAEGNKLPRFGETVLITVEFESGSRLVFLAYRKPTIFRSWYWMYASENKCWENVIAWKPTDPYNPDHIRDAGKVD